MSQADGFIAASSRVADQVVRGGRQRHGEDGEVRLGQRLDAWRRSGRRARPPGARRPLRVTPITRMPSPARGAGDGPADVPEADEAERGPAAGAADRRLDPAALPLLGSELLHPLRDPEAPPQRVLGHPRAEDARRARQDHPPRQLGDDEPLDAGPHALHPARAWGRGGAAGWGILHAYRISVSATRSAASSGVDATRTLRDGRGSRTSSA